MATCPSHPTEDRETCPACVIAGEQQWEGRDDALNDLDPYD